MDERRRILKMEKKRKSYIAPQINMEVVHLESCIGAASAGARINPGKNATPNMPDVEQWETQNGFSNDLDL